MLLLGCVFRPNINIVISLPHKIQQVSVTLAMRPVRHHVTQSHIFPPERALASLFEGRGFTDLVGERRACVPLSGGNVEQVLRLTGFAAMNYNHIKLS